MCVCVLRARLLRACVCACFCVCVCVCFCVCVCLLLCVCVCVCFCVCVWYEVCGLDIKATQRVSKTQPIPAVNCRSVTTTLSRALHARRPSTSARPSPQSVRTNTQHWLSLEPASSTHTAPQLTLRPNSTRVTHLPLSPHSLCSNSLSHCARPTFAWQ